MVLKMRTNEVICMINKGYYLVKDGNRLWAYLED